VGGLLHGGSSAFKSPLRVQSHFLRRSRDCQRKGRRSACQQRDELRKRLRERDRKLSKRDSEVAQLQRVAQSLRAQLQQLGQAAPAPAFVDSPVGAHGYGARMIAMAILLVQSGVGLRATARAIGIIFATLGISAKIPHFTTIRLWTMRLGCGVLAQEIEKASDWVWMMDHSVQIGQEKVLAVLAIRAANLPPAGTAIQYEHMIPLAVLPRTSWTKQDVYQAIVDLAKMHGCPRAILSDHGGELIGGIELFRKDYPDVIELYDFKHYAACRLKAILNNNASFKQFQAQVGKTRSVIQQTELSFLTPPAPKPKARFMNLGAALNWAKRQLRLLDNPLPEKLDFVTRPRLEEKLGWVREHRQDLAQWEELQQVVDMGVTFANQQGVFAGAAKELRAALPAKLKHSESRQLANQLVDFVKTQEGKLAPAERLPLSTEILESSFSKFKTLEAQHCKQGFTGLILAYGAVLTKVTPEKIQAIFAITSVRTVRDWIQKHLGLTFAAKRVISYYNCRSLGGATKVLKPT
jgi:hypothetical protein